MAQSRPKITMSDNIYSRIVINNNADKAAFEQHVSFTISLFSRHNEANKEC